MNSEMIVFVADAGSASKGNFHWVCSASIDRAFNNVENLSESIISHLEAGRKVALGYESPLFVPLPSAYKKLGKARDGECTPATGNRPFNAGAGGSLFATGIQSLVWVLHRIKSLRPATTATTSVADFRSGVGELLVWEAFVSGSEKADPPSHEGDARLAVKAFQTVIQHNQPLSAIHDKSVFSLVGAAILSAGLAYDLNMLCQPCLVIRPLPKEVPDA